MDTLFPALTEDDTFDRGDAEKIRRDYVCSVCYTELDIVTIHGEWRVLVVCREHGNVTQVGRLRRSTVSIMMERAHRRYEEFIRTFPDLYDWAIKELEESRAEQEADRLHRRDEMDKLIKAHFEKARNEKPDPVSDLTWRMWEESKEKARRENIDFTKMDKVRRYLETDRSMIQKIKEIETTIKLKRKNAHVTT